MYFRLVPGVFLQRPGPKHKYLQGFVPPRAQAQIFARFGTARGSNTNICKVWYRPGPNHKYLQGLVPPGAQTPILQGLVLPTQMFAIFLGFRFPFTYQTAILAAGVVGLDHRCRCPGDRRCSGAPMTCVPWRVEWERN